MYASGVSTAMGIAAPQQRAGGRRDDVSYDDAWADPLLHGCV